MILWKILPAKLGYVSLREYTKSGTLDYLSFVIIGVAQLYSYNSLLSAADYFYRRLDGENDLQNALQSSIVSVTTCTSLLTMLLLIRLQKNANYPFRLFSSLLLNVVSFLPLALACLLWTTGFGKTYFVFILVITFISATSTSLSQNATFSYTNEYDHEKSLVYIQAVMTGQGLAGILPSLVEVVAVLSADKSEEKSSGKSEFVYFLASSGVSVLASILFWRLLRYSPPTVPPPSEDENDIQNNGLSKETSPFVLLKKLRVVVFAVTFCFGYSVQEVHADQ